MSRGVSKLGRKTLLAIIDHITQVLPGPDGDYVLPLLQDYVKALAEVLAREAHVELLARKDGTPWEVCVDFFIDLATHITPEAGDPSSLSLSRASPAPVNVATRSTGRSNSSTQSQKRVAHGEGGPLRDALEGLHRLMCGSNAPILRRSTEVLDVVIRLLKVRQLSLGSVQTLCFSIANNIFIALQVDRIDKAIDLVRELVPLMAYWWRSEKVSQDELIRALRNEILKAIFLTQSHTEYLASSVDDDSVRSNLEELADHLWQEYSKRSEAFRLQLVDITFATSRLPADSLRSSLFGLRSHNLEGESYWGLVQSLAYLESLLLSGSKARVNSHDNDQGEYRQPRKRRRTEQDSSRLRRKLLSTDVGTRRTALQIMPFMVQTSALGPSECAEILDELLTIAANKDAITCSWALIAIARYVTIRVFCKWSLSDISSFVTEIGDKKINSDVWPQIWHLAARSISLPGTSRAACLLLSTIVRADILPYHAISEEVNNIVTTADVNGPATLSDTSLALMRDLFHLRNTRVPNASQSTCSHLIRWTFLKWNPSTFHRPKCRSILITRPQVNQRLLRSSPSMSISSTWSIFSVCAVVCRY